MAHTVLGKIVKKNVISMDIIPDVSTWSNRPILIRRSPSMLMSSIEEDSSMSNSLLSPLTLHQDGKISEIPIESDLFVGKILFTAKGVEGACDDYFRRKRRKSRMLLQALLLLHIILLYNLSKIKRNRSVVFFKMY